MRRTVKPGTAAKNMMYRQPAADVTRGFIRDRKGEKQQTGKDSRGQIENEKRACREEVMNRGRDKQIEMARKGTERRKKDVGKKYGNGKKI